MSPAPVAVAALLLLSLPPLDGWLRPVLAGVLDAVCGPSPPTSWCRVPRPVPWLAGVHAVAYIGFLLASAHLAHGIWTGRYRKPANYRPGSATNFEKITWFAVWFFVAGGAQLFPLRMSPLNEFGVIFAVGALILGLVSARNLLISLRYPGHAA